MRDPRDHPTPRDAALADRLRDALPAPPLEDVDWGALHGRVMAAARPRLRAATWWEPMGAWAARGIPATAAAAALAAFALAVLPPRDRAADYARLASDGARYSLEDALAADLPEPTRALFAAGGGDADPGLLLLFEGDDW
jgi:hypothetical protein